MDLIKQSYQLSYLNVEKENLPHLSNIELVLRTQRNRGNNIEYLKTNKFKKLKEDLKFYHNKDFKFQLKAISKESQNQSGRYSDSQNDEISCN